jgi:hypothetical protein
MTGVIYALADCGLDERCKIGKDTKWPERFMRARSHTPRGIRVLAIWEINGTELAKAEDDAAESLPKRTATRAIEWYDVPTSSAIERVTANLSVQPKTLRAAPIVRPYDDWRSLPEEDRGFRKRIWVHVEAGPLERKKPRIKVIPSVFLDTAYRFTFTYNPWPVYLVAGYQWPCAATNGRHEEANGAMWQVWEGLLARHGTGVPATSIGRLDEGTEFRTVTHFLENAGLVSYDLNSPKPQDAPPKTRQCEW